MNITFSTINIQAQGSHHNNRQAHQAHEQI